MPPGLIRSVRDASLFESPERNNSAVLPRFNGQVIWLKLPIPEGCWKATGNLDAGRKLAGEGSTLVWHAPVQTDSALFDQIQDRQGMAAIQQVARDLHSAWAPAGRHASGPPNHPPAARAE